MMDGSIDWAGLDTIAEYLNVEDAEMFINALLRLKENVDMIKRAEHG